MDGPGALRTGRRATVGAAAADALGLVLPVECAGCGRWDEALCPACGDLLRAPLRRCEEDAPALADLPAWCLGAYTGPLRAMVLAWKNHRRIDIGGAVLQGARRAGRAWAAELMTGTLPESPDGAGRPGLTGTLLVVPAPSGWRRRLTRRLVVADLAVAVGRGLAEGLRADAAPVGQVLVVDALRRRGGPRHQAGLGARGRRAGRQGTVRAVVAVPAGAWVVLVDDVLTTGATLAESVRALGAARVVGAFVLAATPPPPEPGRPGPPALSAPREPSPPVGGRTRSGGGGEL